VVSNRAWMKRGSQFIGKLYSEVQRKTLSITLRLTQKQTTMEISVLSENLSDIENIQLPSVVRGFLLHWYCFELVTRRYLKALRCGLLVKKQVISQHIGVTWEM